jgi:hypothetical protein
VTRPLPVGTPDSYTTSFNTPLSISGSGVLFNDSSPLSLPLTAQLETTASHGSVSLSSNGSFSYTPTAGYSGADFFTYRAFDGAYSAPVGVSLTVLGPVAQAITFTSSPPAGAIVGGSYSVSATGGASGNPVVFSVDPAAGAVCTIAGATVSFTGGGTCIINANQAGGGQFTSAPQEQQSFAVTRPLPIATPDSYTTSYNTPLSIAASGSDQ